MTSFPVERWGGAYHSNPCVCHSYSLPGLHYIVYVAKLTQFCFLFFLKIIFYLHHTHKAHAVLFLIHIYILYAIINYPA